MAIVIKENQPLDLGTALGAGLGEGIANGANIALDRVLKQQQADAFQQKLNALTKAGSLEQAMNLIITGGLATNADELSKLAATAKTLFGQQSESEKTTPTQVVDETSGAVFTVPLTRQEILDPEALKRAFPGRHVRLASEGEKKPIDWYTIDGKFIKRSATRPPGGFPLEAVREQAKASESPKNDVLDPTGRLKNETTRALLSAVDRTLNQYDEEGKLIKAADPEVKSFVLEKAAALVRSGEMPDPLPAVAEAVGEAMKRFPEKFGRRPFSVYIDGIRAIDRATLVLGRAIGVPSAAKQVLNYVTGVASDLGFAEDIAFPNVAEARQQLLQLERNLQEALKVGDRLPVWEQQLNQANVPKPSEFLKSPEIALRQLRALRNSFVNRAKAAAHNLGLPEPKIPTLADNIRQMSIEDLKNVDTSLLGPDELKALQQRLDELGF